jgi:sec-independent protein translocase protein TatC
MRKQAKNPNSKTPATANSAKAKLPLVEHLYELRRRLFYVALCIAVGSAIAYGLERQLIAVLLQPSHGQHFIYTSPLGGINFIFSVCLYIGVAVSIPVIAYHLLRFLQPLMRGTTARFIFVASAASGVVAALGIVFGYFIGLPSALHFLLHQFTGSSQIQALLTIQSYLSFVIAYMFGSALMFQLPLILLFINRIKPLKPSKMFHYERHIIIFAFIAAFIMNPTPNIFDQLLVVVPIILMYQVGILLVWYINRIKKPQKKVMGLLALDAESQAKRAELASQLKPIVLAAAPEPTRVLTRPMDLPVQDIALQAGRVRPRSYVNDFVRPQSVTTTLLQQQAPPSS